MSTAWTPRRSRRSGDRFIPVRERDSALGLDSTQLRFQLQVATELSFQGRNTPSRDIAAESENNASDVGQVTESSPSRRLRDTSPMHQRRLLMAARARHVEGSEALATFVPGHQIESELSLAQAAERYIENARRDWSDIFGASPSAPALLVSGSERAGQRSVQLETSPDADEGALTYQSRLGRSVNEPPVESSRESGTSPNRGLAAAERAGVRAELETLLATLSVGRASDARNGAYDGSERPARTSRTEQPPARRQSRRERELADLLERMDREQRDANHSVSSSSRSSTVEQIRALLQAAAELGDAADDVAVVDLAMELFADPRALYSMETLRGSVQHLAGTLMRGTLASPGGTGISSLAPGMLATDVGSRVTELQGVITWSEGGTVTRPGAANANAVLALSAHLPPHAQHATIESATRSANEAAYLTQTSGTGGAAPNTSTPGISPSTTGRFVVSAPGGPSTYAIILENELLHEVNTTRTELATDMDALVAENESTSPTEPPPSGRRPEPGFGLATPPRHSNPTRATRNSPLAASPGASHVSSSSATPVVARRSLLEFSRQDTSVHESSPSPRHRQYSENNGSPIRLDALRTSPVLAADPTIARQLGLGLRRKQRKISRVPFKVLDAPNLADDFYLNLLDWSARNILAVGLGNSVYLWNAYNSKVSKLCELDTPPQGVCSVSWAPSGDLIAVGLASGVVHLYDPTRQEAAQMLTGHTARVGCLAWNGPLLASGSRDRTIMEHDVRAGREPVRTLEAHRQEVCGLRWSFDQTQLASGGNDNKLFIWTPQARRPLFRFEEHEAAVKAVAWSPHQHCLLASGGGTADRCIRLWNTTTGSLLQCVDTGSQVCNLLWSRAVNELVSTHGYSQNQIVLWRYPSMQKVVTLTGHLLRVLYLAASPDGSVIVTGAGDETLRFWNVFPPPRSAARMSHQRAASSLSPSRLGGTRSLYAAALADLTTLPSAYAPTPSQASPMHDLWNTSAMIPSSFIR
jgi:WD40 repeat protein